MSTKSTNQSAGPQSGGQISKDTKKGIFHINEQLIVWLHAVQWVSIVATCACLPLLISFLMSYLVIADDGIPQAKFDLTEQINFGSLTFIGFAIAISSYVDIMYTDNLKLGKWRQIQMFSIIIFTICCFYSCQAYGRNESGVLLLDSKTCEELKYGINTQMMMWINFGLLIWAILFSVSAKAKQFGSR